MAPLTLGREVAAGPESARVHALYGFCRYADEIMDDPGDAGLAGAARRLAYLQDRLFTDLQRDRSDDLILAALVDTVLTLGISQDALRRFMGAMVMDLSVTEYESWDDLCGYMDGSARPWGRSCCPSFSPRIRSPPGSRPRALGLAFQFTNFLRDVGEDLDGDGCTFRLRIWSVSGPTPGRGRSARSGLSLMRFQVETGAPVVLRSGQGHFLSGGPGSRLRAHRPPPLQRHPGSDRSQRL